jgi:threonine dehydrogenase-like Zn-dependent dehydrogenase
MASPHLSAPALAGRAPTIRAVVQTGPKMFEIQKFERPRIGTDDGLLKLEACGICGTDIEQYSGHLKIVDYPYIPGHEPLGIIADIGAEAAARWGVAPGDRVAVEPLIACGHCDMCARGEPNTCPNWMSYGFNSSLQTPGLYGGYADYMYLAPGTRLHRMDPTIPAEVAAWFNPMGAGVRWAVGVPSLAPGDTIVILGSGQRGLASVIAAKAAGAARIIVTDVARAAHKLELARRFGADHTIVVDHEDCVGAVKRLTNGRGADVVVDVSTAPGPVADAVEVVRNGGTIVLAGMKGDNSVNLLTDRIVLRSIRLQGVFTVDSASYVTAIRLVEQHHRDLAGVGSLAFPLERAEDAIGRLAGWDGRPPAIHVVLKPDAN